MAEPWETEQFKKNKKTTDATTTQAAPPANIPAPARFRTRSVDAVADPIAREALSRGRSPEGYVPRQKVDLLGALRRGTAPAYEVKAMDEAAATSKVAAAAAEDTRIKALPRIPVPAMPARTPVPAVTARPAAPAATAQPTTPGITAGNITAPTAPTEATTGYRIIKNGAVPILTNSGLTNAEVQGGAFTRNGVRQQGQSLANNGVAPARTPGAIPSSIQTVDDLTFGAGRTAPLPLPTNATTAQRLARTNEVDDMRRQITSMQGDNIATALFDMNIESAKNRAANAGDAKRQELAIDEAKTARQESREDAAAKRADNEAKGWKPISREERNDIGEVVKVQDFWKIGADGNPMYLSQSGNQAGDAAGGSVWTPPEGAKPVIGPDGKPRTKDGKPVYELDGQMYFEGAA